MTPQEKSRRIVDDFQVIEDREDRLMYLFDLGKRNPELDENNQIEQFRVEGCQSNLWLVPEFKDGRCFFSTDADALTTKGVAAVLQQVCSGATPEEILALDMDFLDEAGIAQYITENRRNGLANLIEKIRGYAEAYQRELSQT